MDIQQIKKRPKQLLVEEEELHCYYIDEGLLTEIFLRASAKTVGRCKCVNKRFNSLISNHQHFITRHSSRPLTDIDGLFHFSKCSAMIYKLPFDNSSSSPSSDMDDLPRQRLFADDDTIRRRIILASCSGFLLLHFLDDMNQFYLCNPTRKKRCLCIPKFNQNQLLSPMFENCWSVGLCIIQPSSSQYSQHHVTNFYSYKLVMVYYDNPRSTYRFIIFSKEIGHWKHSKKTISCTYSQLFEWNNSVYYRGALHWLREKGDILAFHVQNEQARMIRIPENMSIRKREGGYQDVWFGVTPRDDLLNMVSVSGNQVVIWVLGDYENMKWQVKRRIETDWIDLTTSLTKFFDGERLVMVEKKIISKEITIIHQAHIYNIRTREQNIKKLPLWLDSCRVFVPCINTLIDL